MMEGPQIAHVAAMIGDPARASILLSLMDGRALTASELSQSAGVGLATTSGHLAKLLAARMVTATKEGRHRYFVLADHDVAHALESLMTLGQRAGGTRVRTGPKNVQLRKARVCYDHLAGELGVSLLNALKNRGLLKGDKELELTADGARFFARLGFQGKDLATGRRPLCRSCLDWSERRYHLAGAIGKFILDDVLTRKLARKDAGRAVLFTAAGERKFREIYGLGEAEA